MDTQAFEAELRREGYQEIMTDPSYKGQVETTPGASNTLKSETLYTGNEGEEKRDRTFTYNFDGSSVKSTRPLLRAFSALPTSS